MSASPKPPSAGNSSALSSPLSKSSASSPDLPPPSNHPSPSPHASPSHRTGTRRSSSRRSAVASPANIPSNHSDLSDGDASSSLTDISDDEANDNRDKAPARSPPFGAGAQQTEGRKSRSSSPSVPSLQNKRGGSSLTAGALWNWTNEASKQKSEDSEELESEELDEDEDDDNDQDRNVNGAVPKKSPNSGEVDDNGNGRVEEEDAEHSVASTLDLHERPPLADGHGPLVSKPPSATSSASDAGSESGPRSSDSDSLSTGDRVDDAPHLSHGQEGTRDRRSASQPVVAGPARLLAATEHERGREPSEADDEGEAVNEALDEDDEDEMDVDEGNEDVDELPTAEATNADEGDHPEMAEADFDLDMDGLDEHANWRKAALDDIAKLEIQMARVRDQVYEDRMREIAREEREIHAGTHPELLHMHKELEARKESRMELADTKLKYAVKAVKAKRQADELVVWGWWRYERDELQRVMADEYTRERRGVERDKANLERYSSPRPITPTMPASFTSPAANHVVLEELLQHATSATLGPPTSIQAALSSPLVEKASHAQVESDLAAIGLRGRAPPPPQPQDMGGGPGVGAPHRDVMHIMPQQQPQVHQGMPPQHQLQQVQHQAQFHIHPHHHMHNPFAHNHQQHPSHVQHQQPQPQLLPPHGPDGSFPSWSADAAVPFPHSHALQHVHNSQVPHHQHMQHQLPPHLHVPHQLQPLQSLPQMVQTHPQPTPISQNQHGRITYPIQSQPTTHAVLQAAERPPSSHAMQIPPPPQTWAIGNKPNGWGDIRKDKEISGNSSSTGKRRRSSPVPPHQMGLQSAPQAMNESGSFSTPFSSHSQSHHSLPPTHSQQNSMPTHHPPQQTQHPTHHQSIDLVSSSRRPSDSHRPKGTKRKAEEDPERMREAKRPELTGVGVQPASTQVAGLSQHQAQLPPRVQPSFSIGPSSHAVSTAAKDKGQQWDQSATATSSHHGSTQSHGHRPSERASPLVATGSGSGNHAGTTSLQGRPPSSQMFPNSDFSRSHPPKVSALPTAMFPSPQTQFPRPSSILMGSQVRPTSPPRTLPLPTSISPPISKQPSATHPPTHSVPATNKVSQKPLVPFGPPPPPTMPANTSQSSVPHPPHAQPSLADPRMSALPPGSRPSQLAKPSSTALASSAAALATMGPPAPVMSLASNAVDHAADVRGIGHPPPPSKYGPMASRLLPPSSQPSSPAGNSRSGSG